MRGCRSAKRPGAIGAIAGFETGFSELLWVAQDYGVYWLSPGSLQPIKVSPSDLDRLIEAQVKAGNLLEAGCYSIGGKKFWHLSSPAWSWEFNLSTKKWTERWSLKPASMDVGAPPAAIRRSTAGWRRSAIRQPALSR
jgi:hypothetical protein